MREPARKMFAQMRAKMDEQFEKTLADAKSEDPRMRFKATERIPSMFAASYFADPLQPNSKKSKERRQAGFAKALATLETLTNDENEDVRAMARVARIRLRKVMNRQAQIREQFEQTLAKSRSPDPKQRYEAAERIPSTFTSAFTSYNFGQKDKSKQAKELRQEGFAKALATLEALLDDEDEDVKAMARVSRIKLREMMARWN